ncbi:hypothetical protein PHYBLDRAFT_175679 [Phycomyces blakesleeanus NRRL 1555(-)]|uniref:C2H2-type zinc finger transcription factor n=1 Tax=Phycomyces blakesleeanus (strain ATCC 8743b / DSM 1359 / FGSC 10004 / NBRC 33097 / NRRL 1555) TaxID=763407 RepID=A0A162ZD09_PHYB8|nr:hypothetical protein PHYBLDRAFT_175679 [Phycomyces blakesleeanus NRRL 1555(-)]OAD65941.1 hypothetical protein PHYBLDRAFT_175679 [Phycomyces blakesleeanus NRRL 1555(-)]|eukprot:XP_018283981.1 hypothetical protein PHYBLDRAFT_175679 [Phycomyces blakesleeanus NRRL 1555(-)]
MHNIFLGTPKRILDWWIEKKKISKDDLVTMQKTAETMVIPGKYTALTKKIGKGFSYMKADKWKSNAHTFFERFCQKCETTYPIKILTCNMHLHLHLHNVICDFEPVYGYWLFGFERFYSLLKNMKTNRKFGFEETYMRKFIEDVHKEDYVNAVLRCPRQASFRQFTFKLISAPMSTSMPITVPTIRQRTFRLQSFIDYSENPNLVIKGYEPLPPSTFPLLTAALTPMSNIHYLHLLEYYKTAYRNQALVHYEEASLSPYFVDNLINKLKSINILNQTYKGHNESGHHGSLIQVKFYGGTGQYVLAYTGQIQYLFTHSFASLSTNNNNCQFRLMHYDQHVFAFVKWFMSADNHSRSLEHVDICYPTISHDSHQSILPVHRILLQVATAEHTTHQNVKKILVIPLPKKHYA